MVVSDFTYEEEQLIENEFQALLADYARTSHRQKVEIITAKSMVSAKPSTTILVALPDYPVICDLGENTTLD